MSRRAQDHQEKGANPQRTSNQLSQYQALIHQQVHPTDAIQRATTAPPSGLRPEDILVLQRAAGNRGVRHTLAHGQTIYEGALPRRWRLPEAEHVVERPDSVQPEDDVSRGRMDKGVRGHPPRAGVQGVVQMQEFTGFDLYARSQKVEELRQRKRNLLEQRARTSESIAKREKYLVTLEIGAGQREKPKSVRTKEWIVKFIESLAGGPPGPGETGREKVEELKLKREFAEQARKERQLIAKGRNRIKELDAKIKAIDSEIAALTFTE